MSPPVPMKRKRTKYEAQERVASALHQLLRDRGLSCYHQTDYDAVGRALEAIMEAFGYATTPVD